MTSSIDKAGRVVIPKAIRAKAGLKPGTQLEIRFEDGEVRLVRKVPGPELVEIRGRLRARATAPVAQRVPVDVARLIEEERDRWPF